MILTERMKIGSRRSGSKQDPDRVGQQLSRGRCIGPFERQGSREVPGETFEEVSDCFRATRKHIRCFAGQVLRLTYSCTSVQSKVQLDGGIVLYATISRKAGISPRNNLTQIKVERGLVR